MVKPIVYRTENKINGKFYYGVHTKGDDSYLGSGVHLKQAIDKYGKENFIRRTIMEFDTAEEAYAFERLIVDELLLKNPKCYNHALGGAAPSSSFRQEVKDKISNSLKNKGKVTCPHCGKVGADNGSMKQWHFDNCGKPDVRDKSFQDKHKKKVVFRGVEYESKREAERMTGIRRYKLKRLIAEEGGMWGD